MTDKPDNHSLAQDWYGHNFRANPELYRVGRSEQGVLTAEPHKSELLIHWRFKTSELAEESSTKIMEMYEVYYTNKDYVGMDMARKFIQMGFSRSMRYYHHSSGKKYNGPVPDDKKGISGSHGREQLPLDLDHEKKKSADIFKKQWDFIRSDPRYKEALTHLKS